MAEAYPLRSFEQAGSDEIEAALEGSEVVFFPSCPFPLPSEDDLKFLREELPLQSKVKNVSYHPESDTVPRFEAPEAVQARVKQILKDHERAVSNYLRDTIPHLARGWTVGTCSFRPLQEKGRDLKPRSSNELVHIDAGAYGATCGNRILRFFVNVNPDVDRVWGTKGSFGSLFKEHQAFNEVARASKQKINIRKGLLDHCYSGLVAALSKAYPLARVVDSSPYDRAMRRIHNYMKESEQFRADNSSYQEIRFPPLSSWMVFTDGVSHAVVSGQHTLVTTMIVPLANCQQPELSPFRILENAA
jgi:hypothetical protein